MAGTIYALLNTLNAIGQIVSMESGLDGRNNTGTDALRVPQ